MRRLLSGGGGAAARSAKSLGPERFDQGGEPLRVLVVGAVAATGQVGDAHQWVEPGLLVGLCQDLVLTLLVWSLGRT